LLRKKANNKDTIKNSNIMKPFTSKHCAPINYGSPLNDLRKSAESKRREAKRKADIASGKLKVTRKTKPIGGRQKLAADGKTWVDIK